MLERTGWQVTSLNDVKPVAGRRQPSLLFRDGHLTAYTGCNAGRLTLTMLARPRVLCPEPAVQQQERTFDDAIERATRAVVAGGRLRLLDTTGAVLLEAIPDSALLLDADGFTWRLDNRSGLWGTDEQTPITLVLDSDRLIGNSGCGEYKASLTRTGNDWTVGVAVRAVMRCPAAAEKRAERFVGVLAAVKSVELSGNTQLRLITPGETLSFTRSGK